MLNMGFRVLVVDDEPDLRDLIAGEVALLGADVTMASCGNDALEHLKTHPANLVISDVRMPRGDGITLMERAKKELPAPPNFVLVTGYADITEEEALKKGAKALFSKPIEWDLLLSTVKKCQMGLC